MIHLALPRSVHAKTNFDLQKGCESPALLFALTLAEYTVTHSREISPTFSSRSLTSWNPSIPGKLGQLVILSRSQVLFGFSFFPPVLGIKEKPNWYHPNVVRLFSKKPLEPLSAGAGGKVRVITWAFQSLPTVLLLSTLAPNLLVHIRICNTLCEHFHG